MRQVSERLFKYHQDDSIQFSKHRRHGKCYDRDERVSSIKYKTELCRNWVEHGDCDYGRLCDFAHGRRELRPPVHHPKYKTQYCRNFTERGWCPYESRCRFIHHVAEARSPSPEPASENECQEHAHVPQLAGMAALFETKWPGLQAGWSSTLAQ